MSDGNEGVLGIPQSSSIRSFSVISRTCLREVFLLCSMQSVYSADTVDLAIQDTRLGSLKTLQRYTGCILQLQLNRLSRTLAGEVLLLCSYAVGVFCNSSWMGHPGHSLEEFYPYVEKQSVDSAVQDTYLRILTTLKRCRRCILQPQPTERFYIWVYFQYIPTFLEYFSLFSRSAVECW